MPSLPLELERLIFEIAVLQDANHHHRIQIALVAKRVYEWIRPILFRVVAIIDPVYFPKVSGVLTTHDWPNTQLINSAQFVRHLLTISKRNSDEFLDMISKFPNIENFASLGTTLISLKIFEKLNDLPLRRLSVYSLPPQPLAFENLSHLEIMFLFKSELSNHQDCKALIQLPKLTHLGFTHVEGVVLFLLKHCASLQVLTCFAQGDLRRVTKSDDPRYLVFRDQLSLRDRAEEWARSANGLIGRWELAEVIIEARKANLFKDTCPYVLPPKTWMDHLNDDGTRWYEEWSRESRNGG